VSASKKPDWRADLQSLRRLLGYLRPYRGRFVAGLAAGAIYGAISGAFPKAVEVVFRKLFESGGEPSWWAVLATVLSIPAYYAVRGGVGFLNTYCLTWVGSRMLRDVRVALFAHLQRLSMEFFVHTRDSTLIQVVHDSTRSIQTSLVGLAGDVVKQPITILVAVGVLATINLWFCLFALLLGAVCLIPMSIIGRKVRSAGRDEDESAGVTLGVLHESLSNIRVIKAYVLEQLQNRKFGRAADLQMKRSMASARRREVLSPLIEWIGSLGIGAALLYVWFARIPFSEFLAVMTGFFMLYEPLKRLGRIYVESQRILAISARIFRLLDRQPDVEPENAVQLESFRGEIRYENVSLRYVRRREALADINLTIPRGTVCALVGPSGSGKTSIVNLLLRFYEPTRGRILIDGHDLREVATHSLRRLIGIVTQETILFADTVADNIAYGRPGASRAEIVEAAKQANAHEFIMALPQQYETVLGDRGQNLSGGQCQRLAIARAILRDPAILVLDEATSSLDAESERQVQKAMAGLMQGRTVIIIAHRLSSARHADQFVVLDQGSIVESGGHDELLQRNGLYRRLYELQVV
jgi:subfamily B ATP-binding cassette protein MsbA